VQAMVNLIGSGCFLHAPIMLFTAVRWSCPTTLLYSLEQYCRIGFALRRVVFLGDYLHLLDTSSAGNVLL
jgi:hypothetical protein